MKELGVSELEPVPSLPYHLYHESGVLLHAAEESSTLRHKALMLEVGIRRVFAIASNDRQLIFKVNSLKGYYRDTIYIRRRPEDVKKDEVQAYRQRLQVMGEPKREAAPRVELDDRKLIRDPGRILQARYLDQITDAGSLHVVPVGARVKRRSRPPFDRTPEDTAEYLGIHHDAVREARQVFRVLRAKEEITSVQGTLIGDISRRVITGLVRDKDLLLNLVHLKTLDDYLIGHSVNVCLLGINIAAAMGYSAEQVLEIAYGGFLHDIGMIRVPPAILNKPGPLTPAERAEVERHPLYSLEILKRVRGIPESTALVAYHAHERLDGSGYTKHRASPHIHRFAKIVAVADVYEALTSTRSYREARIPYKAMEEIVQMGNKRKLDAEVIKAFLRFICLYPVGSWVELSDGRIGKVISANEERYDRPVVTVFYDHEKKRLIRPVPLDLAQDPVLRVVKAMDGKGLAKELMAGF